MLSEVSEAAGFAQLNLDLSEQAKRSAGVRGRVTSGGAAGGPIFLILSFRLLRNGNSACHRLNKWIEYRHHKHLEALLPWSFEVFAYRAR